MNFIGLGNSGSRLLRDYNAFFNRSTTLRASRGLDRFVLGDADTNNSVIHKVRADGLDKLKQPEGITVLNLPEFWSGGCGVYHIIGELLANTAFNSGTIRDLLAGIGIDKESSAKVVLLFGAGGGTGGGVGGQLLRQGAPSFQRNQLRAVAVLPETDQFMTGETRITGPDAFQLNSAGRFLVRFLSRAHQEGDTGPDLLLLSNGYLLPPPRPPGNPAPAGAGAIGYQTRVERLNDYFARALALISPWADATPPRHGLITFGVGAIRTGGRAAQNLDAGGVARRLVRSALSPIELETSSVTGLSTLPMAKAEYARAFDQLFPPAPDAALNHTGPLSCMLRKCQSVHSRLVVREGHLIATDALIKAVQEQLLALFPDVNIKPPLGPDTVDAGVLTDAAGPTVPYDIGITRLLDELLVEDVYRLINYYLQSSFRWERGSDERCGARDIAQLVRTLLNEKAMDSNTISKRFKNPETLHVVQPQEVYALRFWGNIDDLRAKVLSSLDMPTDDFDQELVSIEEVADALTYLHTRIWRRAGERPWEGANGRPTARRAGRR